MKIESRGKIYFPVRVTSGRVLSNNQSLEFKTMILAEMKIENHGKIYFPWKTSDKHTSFFYENSNDGSMNAN